MRLKKIEEKIEQHKALYKQSLSKLYKNCELYEKVYRAIGNKEVILSVSEQNVRCSYYCSTNDFKKEAEEILDLFEVLPYTDIKYWFSEYTETLDYKYILPTGQALHVWIYPLQGSCEVIYEEQTQNVAIGFNCKWRHYGYLS